LQIKQQALTDLKEQMENVKNAKNGELATLKSQMDKLKADLEAKQKVMMDELGYYK